MNDIYKLGEILLLILINAYFVALEFAIVQIRPSRISTLISEGNKVAIRCKQIKDNLNSYLSATQLGITLVGLLLGCIGEPVITDLLKLGVGHLSLPLPVVTINSISVVLALGILTMLEVILGELVPKAIALYKVEECNLALSGSLLVFYKLTYPIIWLFDSLTGVCLKPFGLTLEFQEQELYSKDELELLVQSSLSNESERRLLGNAFRFEECKACDIMVHRKNMICIHEGASEPDIMATITNNGFTRYPVIGEDKDEIKGYVHIRDIYRDIVQDNQLDFSEAIRPVSTYLEITPVQEIFKALKKNKEQFCIVIDEYGGTSGLLTMEDILEELVGEIGDEFDDILEEKPVSKEVY